ncbi:MAG TPA: hypothetical protein VNO75_08615 [Gemmatimonadaceae bacterium]|nr:hypothetical protein [Gemmatimonadaceae bacterium]
MTGQIPERQDIQFRQAKQARNPFSRESLIGFTLLSILFNGFLVAIGWVAGSAIRIGVILLGIDAFMLGLWIIGIPIRRWLVRPPS